jgi:hypothetical protein
MQRLGMAAMTKRGAACHTGYKQELKRDFNMFTNGAISFSIISILTGVTGAHACSMCSNSAV